MNLRDIFTFNAKAAAPMALGPNVAQKPLTREAAKATGHVLWVEERDPVKAFKTMHDGLQRAPFNCAVWADAGKRLDRHSLSLVRAWRAANALTLNYFSPFHLPPRDKGSLEDYARAYLDEYFAQMETGGQDKGAFLRARQVLRAVANDNLAGILGALPVQDLAYELRANKMTEDSISNSHTDGHMNAVLAMRGEKRTLRVLQSLGGPSTFVVGNRDISLQPIPGHAPSYKADLTRPVTFWETPENSVVILTNDQHHCQPVVHGAAITPPGSVPLPRTVSVFDLAL